MDHIVHGVAKSWTQLSNFHFHSIVSDTDNGYGECIRILAGNRWLIQIG